MQHHSRAVLAASAAVATMATGLVAAPSSHAAQPATAWATASLNVRSGPGTTYSVIGGLRPGQQVQVLSTQNGWSTISYAGGKAYVSSQYLRTEASTAPAPVPTTPTTLPASTRVTTAHVNARSGPSLDDRIIRVVREGTTVTLTGVVRNKFAQVRLDGGLAWMHTAYLGSSVTKPAPGAKPAPTAPKAPTTAGVRWTNDSLNVRPVPGYSRAPVGFFPKGAQVKVTGVVQGEWTQILYSGVVRWVSSKYLTPVAPLSAGAPAPSEGLPRLTAKSNRAYAEVKHAFPELTTIYGWRVSNGDHGAGRAVDFMINRYRTNQVLGDRVAAYLQANAERLDVKYIIWKQRIWLADYPERGWRHMDDRGSDTQNHYDHVHLSVKA